jgi:hypothetical protein
MNSVNRGFAVRADQILAANIVNIFRAVLFTHKEKFNPLRVLRLCGKLSV